MHNPALVADYFGGGSYGLFQGPKGEDSYAHRCDCLKEIPRKGSRWIRNCGVDEGSRPDVGGFYKHFDSRDELVAEAVSAAFGVWQRQKEAAESGGQPLSFAKLIDDYMSDVHRKNPGAGCAFRALAPEIARSDKRTRALTSEQVRNDLQLIAAFRPAKDKRTARSRAILTFSALVGAMALARAVSDEALSREILNTVAELLKDSAQEHQQGKRV